MISGFGGFAAGCHAQKAEAEQSKRAWLRNIGSDGFVTQVVHHRYLAVAAGFEDAQTRDRRAGLKPMNIGAAYISH